LRVSLKSQPFANGEDRGTDVVEISPGFAKALARMHNMRELTDG